MNKSDTHAFINQLLVYTLVMICFSGSIGLGTVWMRHQISITANATRKIDALISETERRIADTNIEVTEEQAPESLDRRNKQWRLGLVAPVESQVVWVPSSTEQRLAAERNKTLLKTESVSPNVNKGARVGVVNR